MPSSVSVTLVYYYSAQLYPPSRIVDFPEEKPVSRVIVVVSLRETWFEYKEGMN
jgi:hypothetical protein